MIYVVKEARITAKEILSLQRVAKNVKKEVIVVVNDKQ